MRLGDRGAYQLRCFSSQGTRDSRRPSANAYSIAPCVSALAGPVAEVAQRNLGSYPTDFRLAMRLAQMALPGLSVESRVIDPAYWFRHPSCGIDYFGSVVDRGRATPSWLANCVLRQTCHGWRFAALFCRLHVSLLVLNFSVFSDKGSVAKTASCPAPSPGAS